MEQLWDHQAAAAGAACTALAGGGRATIVAAAGTGKTITAAVISRQLAPAGRVLVIIPLPGQLAPAAAGWAARLGPAAGRAGICAGTAAAAALSRQAPGLAAETVTDPAALAHMLAVRGRVTVLADSAGLPVIMAAHRDHDAPPWDLIVTHDAHLTSRGLAWAPAHHDELIPAARRLYLTATPAITDGTGEDLAGLDNPARFGPVVHRTTFAQAASLGLAADYQVAVVLVPAAQAAQAAGSRRPGAAQTAASCIAVIEAIRTWDLHELIAVHDRKPAAARFTSALPSDLPRIRSARRAPRTVTTTCLSQAGDTGPGGGHLTVTGCPDAVAFLTPKTTQGGIVQAAGQALRHGRHPVITFIVPVLLPAAGTLAEALEDTTAFDPAWKLIRALRAHDERLAAWLDTSRASHARGTPPGQPGWLHVLGTPATRQAITAVHARMVAAVTSAWAANYAALEEYRTRTGHADLPPGYQANGIDLRTWLDDTCLLWRAGKLPAGRAGALARLGVALSRTDAAWQRGLAAARDWQAAHGDLDVPCQHVTSDGFALYNWLARLHRPARRDRLTPGQRAALDALGFDWDPLATQWQAALAQLRTFRQQHGHAGIPLRYITPSGLKLGNWLSTNRRAYQAGTLSPARIAALEQLGVTWDPSAAAWEHNLAHLAGFAAEHGHTRVPQQYTAPDGCKLGRWVSRQRHRHAHPGKNPLTSQQVSNLTASGMVLDPAVPHPPRHDPSPGTPDSTRQQAGTAVMSSQHSTVTASRTAPAGAR